MAGRKTFVASEILTAADVNSFLMDQSVMVFDDSAARTTAIPTPTEGMVTYLKSDDQVTVFDGAAYKPVGGLVAVKDVLKTDTFSASVTGGGNVAVTGLSITHEVQDPANKLIITGVFGFVATSTADARTGVAIDDGSGFLQTPSSPGSRAAVMMAGRTGGTSNQTHLSHTLTVVHTPGAGSKTYSMKLINSSGSTHTLYLNRVDNDVDSIERPRGVSALIIQEVAV